MRLKRVDKIKIVKHITWNRRKKNEQANAFITSQSKTYIR